MKRSHAVVVLAAGGSTRLGQAKQLLTIDGETLVHRAVRLADETEPVQTVVVTGADTDDIAVAIRDLDCHEVANPDWNAGMAGSLRAAGRALTADAARILILVCDQPALQRRHLDALLDGAVGSSSGCAATRHDGVLGVPAVVPRHWFQSTDVAGDAGFAGRLRALAPADVFGLDAPELALDIDTPGDLAQARAQGWLDP